MKNFKIIVTVPFLLCLLVSGVIAVAADDTDIDGKPLSQLLKQLGGDNRGLQIRAAQTLSAAATNTDLKANIFPMVLPILKSERENDKFVAAQVLGVCGPSAKAAVADLLPMLKGTQYERNRAAAAKAIGQILKDAPAGAETEKVVANLIEAFGDSYEDVVRESITACGMIGPAAKACIPHMARMMQGGEGRPSACSVAAAWTCERMGPLAKEHVDLLIATMNKSGSWSSSFVLALGAIGPVQDNIVPNIVNKMELDTAANTDYWAVLEKFGPKAAGAVPFAKRILTYHGWGSADVGGNLVGRINLKIAILKFFQKVGPDGREALPEVKTMAEDHEKTIENLSSHWGWGSEEKPKELAARLRMEANKTLTILSGKE